MNKIKIKLNRSQFESLFLNMQQEVMSFADKRNASDYDMLLHALAGEFIEKHAVKYSFPNTPNPAVSFSIAQAIAFRKDWQQWPTTDGYLKMTLSFIIGELDKFLKR